MSVSRRALRRVLLAPSIQEERQPEGEDYEESDGDGVHEAPDEVVAGPPPHEGDRRADEEGSYYYNGPHACLIYVYIYVCGKGSVLLCAAQTYA